MRKLLTHIMTIAIFSMINNDALAEDCQKVSSKDLYENIWCAVDGYAVAIKNHHYILLDKNGHIAKDLNYDVIVKTIPHAYIVTSKINNKLRWGIIKSNGDTLLSLEYDFISSISTIASNDLKSNLVLVQANGKYGIIDLNGDLTAKLKYSRVIPIFKKNIYAIVAENDRKWNLIDYQGKEISSYPYHIIKTKNDIYNNAVILRLVNGKLKFGIYDFNTAKEIIPAIFEDTLDNLYEDRARVIRYNKSTRKYEHAYIDNTGQYITNYQFDDSNNFNNGIAVVKKNGKFGIIDRSGKLIVPMQYKDIGTLSDGLIAVVDEAGKVGFVDTKGALVIPIIYGAAAPFKNGLAAVYKDGKQMFINKNNEIVTDFKYDFTGPWRDGLAQVSRNKKVGLINTQGKEVVAPQFDGIEYFANNLATVRVGRKYGAINSKGQLVLPVEYDYLHKNFGRFPASIIVKNGKFALINNNAKILTPLDYDDISVIDDSKILFSYKKGSQKGYLDSHANAYDEIMPLGVWDSFRVKQGDKYGIIGRDGALIFPVEYNVIGLGTKLDKYLPIAKDGKYGFITPDNLNLIIPLKYTNVRSFNKNMPT